MAEPQSHVSSNKFNAFVRKSVDRASMALKFVPFDKKEKENGQDEVSTGKKEHRRAQVRKAQIEHRQRKESHIKNLEQEISALRDMIENAEKQSHIFKLENEDIKKVLKQSNHLNIPQTQFRANHTPISSGASQLSEDLASFDNIASVDFDELMNVSYLQLNPVNEFGIATTKEDTLMGFVVGTSDIKTEPVAPHPQATVAEVEEEMDPSQEDHEVALKAINFILALEHPCRTHFLPKGDTPAPGLPVLPSDVPSGHELMASTYLYSHAPLPVFQKMHWTASHPAPPSSTPWKVPTTPRQELQKLWDMSASLSKNDWEITPVQAWFMLVERLGTDVLMRKGVVEKLKKRLGLLVECFGFGATMNEGLFWGAVRDAEVVGG